MPHFLLKSEPVEYSYDMLVRDGKTVWNGVTNNLAQKNLRSMKKGDTCFIYHSGKEKAIVGIALVTSDPYHEAQDQDPRTVVIALEPIRKLKRPVTLDELKDSRTLRSFDLLRLPRLSVMPVEEKFWKAILKLSGEK